MGRALIAVKALPRARVRPPPVDPLEDSRVARLTERFLELKRQVYRNLVDVAVELGEILEEGKEILGKSYPRWLDDGLGIERRTAGNYLSLARVARESPGTVQRWKELGATKLYQLARIPAAARREVLRKEGLQGMGDREFSALIRPHVVRRRTVTGNMRAHGFRMKVRAFLETIEGARLPGIESAEIRSGLRRDLLLLSRRAVELARRLPSPGAR
jgi:hypothetical protein